MRTPRFLLVVADDFGIGPATSSGILRLADMGRVTATVLLLTSPYAAEAVRAWRDAGQRLTLGWHPCLTLDSPLSSPKSVPSLVTPQGKFPSLGGFLARLATGRIREAELEQELAAQLAGFQELVGCSPVLVNAHHHIHIFPMVDRVLRRLLAPLHPRPYLRRVCEPWTTLRTIPGARLKRAFLNAWGTAQARRATAQGFPGNEVLAGVADPEGPGDPWFFQRWLQHTPGHIVELTCHPGDEDATLIGRDCQAGAAQYWRRTREQQLLEAASFAEACQANSFTLISPLDLPLCGVIPHALRAPL